MSLLENGEQHCIKVINNNNNILLHTSNSSTDKNIQHGNPGLLTASENSEDGLPWN